MSKIPGASLPSGIPQPYMGSYVNTSQTVTSQFVQQFYTVLHNAPKQLHRFYSDQSTFSVGNARGDGTVHTALGQQEIHAAVQGLGFEEAVTEIYSVESQPSALGGVVIQVSGTLQGKDKAKRPFMQTFFLAVQEKGYFVLNDMFRFLPMALTGLVSAEPQGPATPEQQPSPSPNPAAARKPAQPSAVTLEPAPVPSAKAPGIIEGAGNTGGLQPASEETGRAEDGTAVPAGNSSASSACSSDKSAGTATGQAPAMTSGSAPAATTSASISAAAATTTAPPPPMSYADRLRAGTSGAAAAKAAPPARTGSSSSSSSTTGMSIPALSTSASGTGAAATTTTATPSTATAPNQQPAKPNPSVFIREIPPTVTQEALEAALSPFGELQPGGIKLKQQRGRDSFAFVDFASPESAAAVLAAGLQLDGRKVVVAEKRARLFFQSSSGARAGSSGRARGGSGERGGAAPGSVPPPSRGGPPRGAYAPPPSTSPPSSTTKGGAGPPHVPPPPPGPGALPPPPPSSYVAYAAPPPQLGHALEIMSYPRTLGGPPPPPFGWQVGRGVGPRPGRGPGGRGAPRGHPVTTGPGSSTGPKPTPPQQQQQTS